MQAKWGSEEAKIDELIMKDAGTGAQKKTQADIIHPWEDTHPF